ncbi:phage tail protein [Escherichia coli]|nr:phage tail protein [Escherichia coli]
MYVFGATEKVIPMTIALSKDTPQIRTAIKAELNALMLRDGVPEGRMYLSRISEAISLSAGEVAHRLIVLHRILTWETELPVLGEITWQAYDPARSK